MKTIKAVTLKRVKYNRNKLISKKYLIAGNDSWQNVEITIFDHNSMPALSIFRTSSM